MNKISPPPPLLRHRVEKSSGNILVCFDDREKEEDIYIWDFVRIFFSRNLTARMNDVRTSVKLNSLLNRASEVFDGETARFR